MASFMSMQYDSDSDSADDLDFEPASDASTDEEGGSELDEAMEEDIPEDENSMATSANASPKPGKKIAARKKSAAADAASLVETAAEPIASGSGSTTTAAGASELGLSITPSQTSSEIPRTLAEAGASAHVDSAVSGEVVKKKKGPKKGTKYKKRTPTVGPDGIKVTGKSSKAPKMTKKAMAAAAAAAAAEAAAVEEATRNAARVAPSGAGRFGFQNTQVDMDHPLESFKWPYSPFTAEFKAQHLARDKMSSELHQAVQQMTDSNGQASWHLQELDQQLQMSRQELKTSLDEIQFRKSQLRDMSLLAVDIVKKLASSPRSARSGALPVKVSQRRQSTSSSGSGALSGNESGTGGYASSYQTTASHLDGDRMEVDEESGGEQQQQYHPHNPQQQHHHHYQREQQDAQQQQQLQQRHQKQQQELQLQSLKGLNEGNVRSFLEKIRALEQAQRQVMV